ncbi:MAG: restriction endonuclease subunit S [Proteobacteria bacterium]|nr:restriction endonuclease subunit S [Pseudomonadota bacterium]
MNTMVFSEFVEINPQTRLVKGQEYPFVAMEIVEPHRRYVIPKQIRDFSGGGTKFLSGDTLFARITPCLENGKIAQFVAPGKTAGFGSTEFFVFRNRQGISDQSYIYYLAKSDTIRKPAEKSMSGASGRQRADVKSIQTLQIPAPPLAIQRKIASILSAYDNLIENNLRRSKILEEMAKTIYEEWFVKFHFPGHEKVKMVESELGLIPEGWKVKNLRDTSSNFDRLRKPLSSMQREKRKGNYPYYGAAKIFDYIDDYLFDGTYLLVAEDGSVITPDRRPLLQYVSGKFWANNHTHILQGKGTVSTEFLYLFLNVFDISGYITGAAQPKITQENLNRIQIAVSDDLLMKRFNQFILPFFQERIILQKKNDVLRQTRDLLLPKLISGEIDVENLDINTGGSNEPDI